MKSMPITNSAATLALVVSLFAATPLLAQRERARDARSGGNYDPATEVTLSGTLDELATIPGPARGPGGLHVMLRTQAGVSEVHLGPVAFMSGQGFELAVGEMITVTGSRVGIEGEEVVIAREIRKGDRVLTLRDARGVPLWARGRKR
jgi:hypothetical protein